MNRFALVLLALAAVVMSAPAPDAAADLEDLPPYVGGPIAKIYKKLDAEQKKEVDKILQESDKDTKAVFKKKIEAFGAKLDKKLQEVLDQDKEDFEKFKKDIREKSKKLGKEGQALYDALKKNFENQDQTFEQEHDALAKILKDAPKEAVEQFQKAEIPLPPADEKN